MPMTKSGGRILAGSIITLDIARARVEAFDREDSGRRGSIGSIPRKGEHVSE